MGNRFVAHYLNCKLYKMKRVAFVVIILFAIFTNVSAQKNSGFHILKTLHIASDGWWDYVELGPINAWIYLSHANQVNILNKNTGDSVGVIEGTTGVHGIAFDVASKKGFTTNGRLNNVFVFDMNTNKVLAEIPTGKNPDAIMYESFSKKMIVCNNTGKSLTIIDGANNTVIDSIDVGGKPEAAVSDGKGKLFVNLEDKNEIAVVDTKTFKVVNHWSIAPGEGPTGLAIDLKTNRLFAGCEKLLLVVDATNGKVIDKLSIGDGCDGVVFDAATKNIYTSNGEGTLTVINEKSANKYVIVENIVTKKSARTITLDTKTHLLYLPAAELDPKNLDQRGRAKMKVGSFQVLVVGK
jgi:YVTN family beta-propeller protein